MLWRLLIVGNSLTFLDIKWNYVKINIDSFVLQKDRFICYKLQVTLLSNFSIKLSNQKYCPNANHVCKNAVISHGRIHVTNSDVLHTKPFTSLVVIVYFSPASVASEADETSTKNMRDVLFQGVRVQLNNGSSKRECHGACAASKFKVYHIITLNLSAFRKRTHIYIYTPEKQSIQTSATKHILQKKNNKNC